MEESADHALLRILMISDTVGGVWSYSVELCHALSGSGVQVHLVATGAPLLPAQQADIDQLPNVTVYDTGYPLEWMEEPWAGIDASATWLLQLEETVQPALIHINGFAYASLPWKAPVLVVAHSDVFSWWISVKGEQPPASWNTYFERVRDGIQGAGLLIAPSQAMMDWIRDIYQVTTPGMVIYNGRDARIFSPGRKEPFVFSMGRIWDEAKNIRLLMEAAPAIRYPIKLAGDSTFAQNSSQPEQAAVTYLGKLPVPDIAEQLSAASIYVLPALYEPFGLSVLEAALSGCALVLGDIGSLREIWGDNALYVDPADAHALADAVNYLAEHEAIRTAYAAKARAHAVRYSAQAMAEQYRQAYTSLLQEKSYLLQQETP